MNDFIVRVYPSGKNCNMSKHREVWTPCDSGFAVLLGPLHVHTFMVPKKNLEAPSKMFPGFFLGGETPEGMFPVSLYKFLEVHSSASDRVSPPHIGSNVLGSNTRTEMLPGHKQGLGCEGHRKTEEEQGKLRGPRAGARELGRGGGGPGRSE